MASGARLAPSGGRAYMSPLVEVAEHGQVVQVAQLAEHVSGAQAAEQDGFSTGRGSPTTSSQRSCSGATGRAWWEHSRAGKDLDAPAAG
jgi:hypothetical protein